MGNRMFRWTLRLMAGAALYPVMQFVVLPMLGKESIPRRDQVMSVWEEVTKRLSASKTTGVRPSSSQAKTDHPGTERSPRSAVTSSAKMVDVNGSQIVISPALNFGKSVRFDTSKATSSSSTNCKPGST